MVMRRSEFFVSAGGLAAALSCVASAAHAQEGGLRPLGGLSRYVHGGVSSSVTYDPNSGRGSDAVTSARGLQKQEVTYTVTGDLDASLPVAGFNTFLAGSVGYQGHSRNSKLDSETVSLAGGVSRRFVSCSVSTGLSWNRGQTQLEQIDLSYTTNTAQSVGVNAAVQCAPVAGINVGVAGGASRSSNSSNAAVSSRSYNVSGNVGYGNRALGTISTFIAYSRLDYPDNPLTPTLTSSTGVNSVNMGVQYSRPLGRKLSGSASVGYVITKPEGPLATKSNDISANVSFNYRPTDRITSSFSYIRNVSATNIVGSSYTVGDTMSATVSFRFLRGVSTSVRASQSIRDYRGGTVTTGPLPATRFTKDKNRSLTGSIGFSPTRNTSLSGNVTYDERTSNLSTFDYNSVRTSLSFTAAF